MDSYFWWDWWVNVAVAIGTFMVAIVALFGDWIKAKLFRPKLFLELVDPKGESTEATLIPPSGEARKEKARYYHIRVSNRALWPSATQTQIFLLRVEAPGPDGDFKPVWTGDVPLRWKFHETQLYPISRTIGQDAICDLCSIVKGKWLELHPLFTPNNLHPKYRDRMNIAVDIQARSNEGVSEMLRLHISWDGQWEDGASEMANHLVIKKFTG